MIADLTYAAVVFLFSLFCAVQDIKEKKVSVFILISAIAAGLILRCLFDIQHLWLSIFCGVGAGLFYFIVRMITRGRLGMADILFGVFQGVILFPMQLFVCILIECSCAASCFLFLKFRQKNAPGVEQGRASGQRLEQGTAPVKERIAFIPFMAAGLIISYMLINLTLN